MSFGAGSRWATLAIGLVAGTVACRASAAPSPDRRGEVSVSAILAQLSPPVQIAGQPPVRFELRDRMRSYSVPAVSITVVRANRIAWSVGIGSTRAGRGDSASTTTLMQAASISKPLVAVAVLRLVERGALSLDDSANARLSSWRIPANDLTRRTPVRIHHLLSHTAGATNGAVGIYGPAAPRPSLLQALDGIAPSNRPPIRIDVEPGTAWRYAGGGYSILQQMLIDVEHKPFPELMRELVLDPAGMGASCFCQPLPDSLVSRAAAGHDASGGVIPGDWWTLPEMAAGGLWTTADDLARFMIQVNRAWSGDASALLRQSTARRMLTPGKGDWGLGFAIDTTLGVLRYSHTGSNNGYRSILIGLPDRGDGIVILTNGDGGANLRDEIVRAVAATYGWPGYAPETRAVAASANPVLTDFAGRYQYDARFASTFTVSRDSLTSSFNQGPPTPLYPEAKDAFFTTQGMTYRFVRDADGRVVSVIALFPDKSQMRGRRAPP